MRISAIVNKELGEADRSAWLYLLRAGYVVLIGAIIWLVATVGRTADPAILGRRIFTVLLRAQVVLGVVLCTVMVPDSLSAERRSGSLSLLVMSSLRPWHIICGKLVSGLLIAAEIVMATMPMVALTTLLGGVSRSDAITGVACVFATLLGGIAVGLYCSAACRRSAGCPLTFILLAGWLWLAAPLCPIDTLSDLARRVSPWHCAMAAVSVGPKSVGQLPYCLSAAVVLAAVAIVMAARAAERLDHRAMRAPGSTATESAGWRWVRRPWWCSRLSWTVSGFGDILPPAAIVAYQAWIATVVVVAGAASGAGAKSWCEWCMWGAWALLLAVVLVTIAWCTQCLVRQKADGRLAVLLCSPYHDTQLAFGCLVACGSLLVPALVTYWVTLVQCLSLGSRLPLWLLLIPDYSYIGNYDFDTSGWYMNISVIWMIHLTMWVVILWLCALLASARSRSRTAACLLGLSPVSLFAVGYLCFAGIVVRDEDNLCLILLTGFFAFVAMFVLFGILTERLRPWLHRV